MDSMVLQLKPPKGNLDAGMKLTYKLVTSYVATVNKVKTTFYCTLTISADGTLIGIDPGVKGDKTANYGGFKTAMDAFDHFSSLNTERVTPGGADCIRITGLPFPGTKYSFALTTIAEDVNGIQWTSAVGKTNIKTLKYNAPKLATGSRVMAGDGSFSVLVSTAANKPDGAITYVVGVYDKVSKEYLFGDAIKTIVGVPEGFEIVSTDGGIIVYKGAAAKMELGIFELVGAIQSDVLKVKVK
jgi:hypothetical protein